MCSTEQKCVFRKRNLVWKSGKAGDLLTFFCAVTFLAVKACMLLNQHKTFVGRDADPKMLSALEQNPVLTVVSQVLKSKYDIDGSSEVGAAAMVFTDEISEL